MIKKKTSKKHKFTLDDLKPVIIDESHFHPYDPSLFFKDKNRVAQALLECLLDNDAQSFMEVLDAYLNINRTQIASTTHLSRTTISNAFSKKGNPTIKTIAKIVHESTGVKK